MEYTATDFWHWFADNSSAYLFVNQVAEPERERLFALLIEQLHRYCAHLWFEIGGHPDENQELIITAEGDINYFGKVTELVAQAPALAQWKFVAFKPPMGADFSVRFADVELTPANMWFLPLSRDDSAALIGLRVGVRNYEQVKDSEWLDSTLAKVLDTLLGEVSYALDIDYVELAPLPDEPEAAGMMKLEELPGYVAWHKKQDFSAQGEGA
ncbi:hypothetical protein [Hymenobacter sp. CRA2]|uniref:hypothetical protein n=1 Tax=Hymenobacter sp. CRA2 TaxID=1955620 RepID=UPI00098F809F|nr:hypothetical protein [Hymenobacter sp. CRA2]OON68875.1 hypothetical protein B0919_11935 [Hymenobacter sp. CRA2]